MGASTSRYGSAGMTAIFDLIQNLRSPLVCWHNGSTVTDELEGEDCFKARRLLGSDSCPPTL